jgi:hypothetical protein
VQAINRLGTFIPEQVTNILHCVVNPDHILVDDMRTCTLGDELVARPFTNIGYDAVVSSVTVMMREA